MKVEAYKSKNGKLFYTEKEAEKENVKSSLVNIFGNEHISVYSIDYVCERFVENRKEIIKLLSSLDNPK